MGNKLSSCSCAPILRKAYRYEDSPWQNSRRRDGHLLRLWAEVFHVSASGAGTVKWQQVSEDLVPVNITCIQDSPECVFHITAYNSQVDKILDVRLLQPGTRIGQASECFVYWKDPMTNDTWGLNFTSPIDAKQFRECCSPSFKFSRKASSSYSLKLEPPGNKQKFKAKRKPLSTPASPNRSSLTYGREPQCTCMTQEQYARLRAQDPRYRSSTLPRTTTRAIETEAGAAGGTAGRSDKVAAATSSTSLYDNVSNSQPAHQPPPKPASRQSDTQPPTRPPKSQETSTMTTNTSTAPKTVTASVGTHGTNTNEETQAGGGSGSSQHTQDLKSEGVQAGGTLTSSKSSATSTRSGKEHLQHMPKSVDYGDGNESDCMNFQSRESDRHAAHHHNVINNNTSGSRRTKSKSTEDMNMEEMIDVLLLDSSTLKRMLKPMPSTDSPVTSPEMGRRRYGGAAPCPPSCGSHGHRHPQHMHHGHYSHIVNNNSRQSSQRRGVGVGAAPSGYPGRGLYLELGGGERDMSPPSDNVMFDNQCYATTPSSSNGNSDQEPCQRRDSRQHHHAKPCLSRQASQSSATPAPGSPTSRLLLEYEMHLRNTLAKGMDAESYSLHTFEALLSQSMEDLEYNDNVSSSNQRSPYPPRRRPTQESILQSLRHLKEAAIRDRAASQCSGGGSRSSTLPLPHRLGVERQHSARSDRDGYYSDRNELMRERERDRERGYLSDHNTRDRVRDRDQGYLSDHQSSFVSASRCASCIGESARAAWYRHSDGWRGAPPPGPRRSPWDSLPSLRHEGSLNDSGYRSNRADSFEQRGVFDRQDSVRSEYTSDRESTRYGIVQQASIDSTDSRICYLTSSEISDDDRMSLTTAVSDEEDPGESAMNSPYKGKQTGAAAASFNCTGAVRKAGFLSVKKWLLRKKHQIELARKRGWKGYWVCLKGTTLLFYPCDSREGRSVEAAPKHLIIVDGAIMQPIPEHPKRDYIFCLSTAFGDAYLFQAPCQIELENWVNSIHSACAAAFARHRGKTGTLHLLQEEIYRLEKAIESDHKLKHMADLQQSVVSDPETRAQLAVQMLQWEENLERLHCEQFRLRCYMASLQSGELPNPKSLLTHVSRGTKSTLNKLGVFTVSSFHAFICARSPSLLNNLLAGRGATKRRAPQLSRSNSGSSRRSMQMSREDGEAAVRVSLPEGTTATVGVREGMSVEEFLAAACARRSLNALEHFVRVKKRRDMEDHNYFVPHRSDLIETYLHTHEVVEVCAKILYQVELQRTTLEQMWGFSVEAELIENAERQDELCCYVSRVEDKSVAMQNGDEIMVINGAIVSDLDMMYLESVLQEELSLVMMMRSSRTEPPELTGVMRAATDDIIDSLVCPPPPSEPPVISDDMISGLIVPAPAWSKELYSPDQDGHGDAVSTGPPKVSSRTNSFEIENLLKSAEQVTGWCRSPAETRRGSPTGSVASAAAGTPSRHLSDADKLKKVLLELVDTERAYVKHLNNLLENYLEPLKKETFLSNAEINALFGNIQEIVTFQRQFLQNLEEALEAEPNFHHFEFSNQFKNVLFAVGNAFLYYVNHFKLYSSFCASHSKAQKVLHPNEGNQALQEFLAARNPKQQHSSTLESYLIKPIQRILKYPLLLQQLRNLTDVNSEEHLHLVEALKGMEKVAEHINEMQRIHEEYGAIFDHLFRQHQKSCKQPIDLSPGDLLYYGGVEWLNISDFLGKIKKGLELHAMCFVFKSAVVFLCKERLRQKKKLMGVSSKNSSNEVEIIRYQVLIPVTEVQVRASSAKDMDSHFLWELIHLRSQLQRRSEKVYVLSNSTADFRNAFLKTIRQIIRESVRNMSLPTSRPAPAPPRAPHTLDRDRPKHQVQVMQGSQTLGKTKKPKTTGQRLSAGNIEVGDLSRENSQDADEPPPEPPPEEPAFRHRSKTLGDATETIVKRAPPPPPPDADKCDPGCKSEGEDEQPPPPAKRGLGRTPNHLTLSTTSTLSAGSTGSQARLIQSSHQPTQYQPTMVKELGKQESQSLKSSPERKSTTAPEKRIKVIRSCSGSSINRDRSPNRSVDHTSPDRDRVTKVIVCKSPNKSSLKQTKTLHRSPRGSFDQSKSPRGSIDKSRSPQQSFDGSRSPRGSIMKSRENSIDRARSPKPAPKKGIMRTPQASFDKSPCKSPNLSRRSSKSGGEKLARLGTNSLDRMTHYSQLAKAEDKAIKMGIVVSKSTESIAKAIEHPTCVQCYLSGKKQSKTS
ncbi:protein still life, isoform SIF type 1 isoform X3 [Helicoverpa zea]|uniref:protein still life, isoform SIF type 1 isoform X3 n=1 Tax=Helicoverpa zea TaxID=7113 RepID=UPI001F5837DD|nr:protein still life, isoform SIF type 1 isoform X3 [Helicoverpa zea]